MHLHHIITISPSPSPLPVCEKSCGRPDPNPNFLHPLKNSYYHHHHLMTNPSLPMKPEANTSKSPYERHESYGQRSADIPFPRDIDPIKARITSHPLYSSLLSAYMDCQKVGAPPEVVARLTATARELKVPQQATSSRRDTMTLDPELDQFMEAYYEMLMKYREELAKPLQDAMDFLKKIESQLNSITNSSSRILYSDDKCEPCFEEDDDQEDSGGESKLPAEINPNAEDYKEVKLHLLKKYSGCGYLSSLRQELSKKKKKGKLPKDARQKLLSWWELHCKWPYPSEMEKVALAESTGLDPKQINNWFINQRKRHWKPSQEMQFVLMNGYYPSSYTEGHLMGNTTPYHLPPI